jgi:hypothetical protein
MDPRVLSLGPREMNKLREWVERGNTLILLQGPPPKAAAPSEGRPSSDLSSIFTSGRWNDPGQFFGLTIKSMDGDGRSILPADLPEMGEDQRISVSNRARWAVSPAGWKVLAGDESGPALLTKRMGKGRVAALSDATLGSNANLPLGRNLRLILTLLLRDGRPREILFDEYHHGKAQADSLAAYLGSSVFYWILLQGALGFGLIVYSLRARQCGRFRSLAEPKGRSSLEYVESMANIFQSSKAAAPALVAVVDRFDRRLRKQSAAGIDGPAAWDVRTSDLTSWAASADAATAASAVRESRAALAAGVDARQALKLARQLGALRHGLAMERSCAAYRPLTQRPIS